MSRARTPLGIAYAEYLPGAPGEIDAVPKVNTKGCE